jgi:hypothetical protein
MLWQPAVVAVAVVTVEVAATEAATALVEMAVASVAARAAGAAALLTVWAEREAEEHPLLRRGNRCRRKAASPAIVGLRAMLPAVKCRPKVA